MVAAIATVSPSKLSLSFLLLHGELHADTYRTTGRACQQLARLLYEEEQEAKEDACPWLRVMSRDSILLIISCFSRKALQSHLAPKCHLLLYVYNSPDVCTGRHIMHHVQARHHNIVSS
jgi:hypothetical protein